MADNIKFSSDPVSDIKNFINTRKYSRICVLTDENTSKFCLPVIQEALPQHEVINVMSGEEHKNLRTCEVIWERMTEFQLDRHSLMIILGGGVLGDMGGFCAATYKRGIDFMLIPTTLLSQVDSSIGGKLGVDFNNLKNHIGVFQVPAFTLLYSGFLKTLPEHELRSGFAEIIKHVIISDPAMWSKIKVKPLHEQNWDELIRHSVEFKAQVTKEDPKEKGLRKILNTGHTIGHAIETFLLSNGRKVMHGEAIAAGMIAENYIARKTLNFEEHVCKEIEKFIISIYGKIEIHSDELSAIARLTLQDKKNKENRVLSVLLEAIGKPKWDCEITMPSIEESLRYYKHIQM